MSEVRHILLMRFPVSMSFAIFCLQPVLGLKGAEPGSVWNELESKRQALKSFHQEFEISRKFESSEHVQASKMAIVLDCAGGRWRERSVSGAGGEVTLFDGKELYSFEEGGDEFVRPKHSSKEGPPQPSPYSTAHLDLTKAVERGRHSCGFTSVDHECVTIDIPVKAWIRYGERGAVKMTGGAARFVFDTSNGLLISARIEEGIGDSLGAYRTDTTYLLNRLSYNADPDESLFRAPSGDMKEVRELSRWDAAKIKKQLAGKTAPDLTLTDLAGKTFKLSDLKGRTVLLDFWATWCGPCQIEIPWFIEFEQQYKSKGLEVVGVSMDEEGWQAVKPYIAERKINYRILLGNDTVSNLYGGLDALPTTFLIDREGKFAFSPHIGLTSKNEFLSEIQTLLGIKPQSAFDRRPMRLLPAVVVPGPTK
jgi:thiol-disulfide isomerase/thioredoxin